MGDDLTHFRLRLVRFVISQQSPTVRLRRRAPPENSSLLQHDCGGFVWSSQRPEVVHEVAFYGAEGFREGLEREEDD
jgi:hypothetical protein